MKSVSRPGNLHRSVVESLESRRLLSVSLQPLSNLQLPQGSAAQTFDLNQFFTDNTTGLADLTFAARSDNTSLVQATVDNSILTLSFAPALAGFAHISIAGTAPDGGSASQTLRLQVTSATPLSVPIGTAGHGTFRFVQSNRTVGQITLTGPGSGTITVGGTDLSLTGNLARGANQELESIALTGTTAATRLIINGIEADRGKSIAEIGNITSDGSIGSIRMQKVDLVGDVTLQGGVSSINVAAAQSSTFSFGQSTGPINLTVGTFNDVSMSTAAPFNLIRGGNWVSTDSVPESFQAAYINRIYMTGNFDVGVQLTGTGATGRDIGKITVGGAIGGRWNVPGASAPLLIGGTTSDWDASFASLPSITDVGSMGGSLTVPSLKYLRVHGSMIGALIDFTGTSGTDLGGMHVYNLIRNSAIESSANLGPILAESLEASIVYAGVGPLTQGQALPAAASDLSSTATIQSITLRPRGKVIGFLASDIAAANIGNLAFTTTEVSNSGVAFGVAAESIGTLTARDLTNRRQLVFTNVHDATVLANQIAAQKLNLEDFNIVVLS